MVENKSGKIISVLDVGSYKVSCFIGMITPEHQLEILGIGYHPNRGMKNGEVIDKEKTEMAIRQAVDSAEQMIGRRIENVIISLNGLPCHSNTLLSEVAIKQNKPIDVEDIYRALQQQNFDHYIQDEDIIHCMPIHYSIDGGEGISDPRGLYGKRLGVGIHLVTAPSNMMKNLTNVIKTCHLNIQAKVVDAYAAGVACLVEDEKELGTLFIDMGGGSTSLSIFLNGYMVYYFTLPVGGMQITNDIARCLSTSLKEAERLKTLYGSCVISPSDDREFLKVKLLGDKFGYDDQDNYETIPRSMLIQIIQARVEEMLFLIQKYLAQEGVMDIGSRIVISGGASQLQGMRECVRSVFNKPVRLASPRLISGLADATAGPSFATPVGLLLYAFKENQYDFLEARKDEKSPLLSSIKKWFKI